MVDIQAAAVQYGIGKIVRRHILDAMLPVKGAQVLQEFLLYNNSRLTPLGCCQSVPWQTPILLFPPFWDHYGIPWMGHCQGWAIVRI